MAVFKPCKSTVFVQNGVFVSLMKLLRNKMRSGKHNKCIDIISTEINTHP